MQHNFQANPYRLRSPRVLWCLTWLFLLLSAHPAQGALSEHLDQEIQRLFPKATRIGEKQPDTPVYPVYQLQELLGYAFESTDLTDLPGFAGEPIRLLIGLDLEGRFAGVRVLDHHEPVFLHGLGQEPLLRFVSQYQGRTVRDQIIIGSAPAGRQGVPAEGPVFIDGVTRATVSVIIINDTVLEAALQVARRALEGFSQGPVSRPRDDLFEPLSWSGLLERGYLRHWQLRQHEVEQALGRPLETYPDWQIDDPDNAPLPFADLYYAYVNAPAIGINLLGETRFRALQAALKRDEQALLVLSRGTYSHVAPSFKPGTVPARLGLSQNNLALELRDLDLFRDGTGTPALPTEHGLAHLFRIKGGAGFDPAAPMQLALSVTLARNHLVSDQVRFTSDYQLPAELFEPAPPAAAPLRPRAPLWHGIWQQRLPEVVILCLALTLLTLGFVAQERLSRLRHFDRVRIGWQLFTLAFIGYYAQGQLSVVNIYTLLLALRDGFDLRLFLLDPVIFLLWCYTFASLFLWGRGLYCGWLCPFGALQELLARVASLAGIRQWRIPAPLHRRLLWLKYPLLLGLVGSAFISLGWAERLAELEPFKTAITLNFKRAWPFVAYALLLLALGLVINKFYCRYLCPLGAGLAVLGRLRRFAWLRRLSLCGSPCQLCRQRCPVNAIGGDGRIDYNECVQCLECLVIVNDPQTCVAGVLAQRKRVSQPSAGASRCTAARPGKG